MYWGEDLGWRNGSFKDSLVLRSPTTNNARESGEEVAGE